MKKLYRKEILRVGEWKHPNAPRGVLKVTKAKLDELISNYKKTPFVPVLRGHIQNTQAEQNPALILNKNIEGLVREGNKLYADMKIDEKELDSYNDVSVSIDNNYIDKTTGKSIGSVLNHVAAVISPYIKDMAPFLALSENDNILINLSDEVSMTKKKTEPKKEKIELEEVTTEETKVEEVVAETKEEAPVKEEEVSKEESKEEVTEETEEAEVIEEVKAEEVKEEEAVETEAEPKEEAEETEEVEEPKEVAVVTSEGEAARIVELEEKLNKAQIELAEGKTEKSYDMLLSAGKLLPVQEEAYKALHLSLLEAKTIELSEEVTVEASDLLAQLFKKAPSVVNLEEVGVDTEEGDKAQEAEAKLKEDLRKLPTHAKKTAEEFDEWFAQHRNRIVEASEEFSAKK